MTTTPGARRTPRIAAVAPNWLGDAVMCLPALSLLAGSGARVALAAPAYVARVFWGFEGIDETWIDPARGRLARIGARARMLRAFSPDAVALFPPSFSSAIPAVVCGVPHRVGFATDARRLLLSSVVGSADRDEHLSSAYARVAARALQAVGLPLENEPRAPRLRVGRAERERVKSRLAQAGLAAGQYAVVVPGAAFGPAKAWPWERYRALCEGFAGELPIALCGSAGDRAACERIGHGLDGVLNLAGETSLGDFFAAVEGARVVIANDSGAPHVAAALGVPVVVLFGSTSPAWTRPLGNDVEVMQHKVHCNPCYRRTCPTELECFNGIEVDAVRGQVRAALRRGRDSGRRAPATSDRIGAARDPDPGVRGPS